MVNPNMSLSRRHIKSRAGCLQCKQRKIKCDEATPSCRNCQRRKFSCSFLLYIPLASRQRSQPSPIVLTPDNFLSGPALPPSGLPLQFSTSDLELLHFYTTTTSNELLGPHMTGTLIWRTSIVTLSFRFPYLLHALFSLSALHLVFLHSKDNQALAKKYIHLATVHHTKCIVLYRLEIQNLNLHNSDACWACASVLALHAWAMPGGQGSNLFFANTDTQVPWYKLHRGGVEVLKSSFNWVKKGALGDMIRPLMVLRLASMPHIPFMSEPGDDIAKLDSIAESWTSSPIADQCPLDDALQTLRHIFGLIPQLSSKSGVQLETSISSCIAILSWTTLVPRRFCEMVEERFPQSLVVVAVYCILLKRVEELWWIKGKAESLFDATEKELGDKQWNVWLQWPREEIYGDNNI